LDDYPFASEGLEYLLPGHSIHHERHWYVKGGDYRGACWPRLVEARGRRHGGPLYHSAALAGNGSHPMSMPAQLGCCRTAPLRPHLEQRADRRNMSLDASGPHLMISGTNATGRRCKHFSQTTQHHG
jgi:hypothetical protein